MTTLSAGPGALGPRGLQVVSRSTVGNLASLCELLLSSLPHCGRGFALPSVYKWSGVCTYVKPRLMVVVGGAFLSPRRAVGNGKVKRTIAPPSLTGIGTKYSQSKCLGSLLSFTPSDFQTLLRSYPVMG